MTEPLSSTPPAQALLTDLYEVTMLQAYHDRGMRGTAVFELFVRALPKGRNFLVAAGLEQVLDYLEALAFTAGEIDWLAGLGRFTPGFLESLAALRFEGDVDALPEGTLVFPDEPLVRVIAPLPQAQVVESRLMNLVHFETLVASKAARCVLAAPGIRLVDFGLRRSHGAEAGLLSARASYLAGFAATATVEAGRRFGIPVAGTMAHSYVQAHASEAEAFEAFARAQPDNAVLLIDTYDTEAAARTVVELAPKLARDGIAIRGVRIDSGDLVAHARNVRAILDAGGLRAATIFASGNLDEHRLAEIAAARAPIDACGVGTRMNTSADAPYLDCAYKLQEYDGRPRRKRSEGKATWPGRKQVFRRYAADGTLAGDTLTVVGDEAPGEPLLVPVMRGGRRLAPSPALDRVRERTCAELARLPAALRSLDDAPVAWRPDIAPALRRLAAEVDAATRPRSSGSA
ncbi:MAG: nicotinate phosphoribosyltransferase [Burkholderiales bacterium]